MQLEAPGVKEHNSHASGLVSDEQSPVLQRAQKHRNPPFPYQFQLNCSKSPPKSSHGRHHLQHATSPLDFCAAPSMKPERHPQRCLFRFTALSLPNKVKSELPEFFLNLCGTSDDFRSDRPNLKSHSQAPYGTNEGTAYDLQASRALSKNAQESGGEGRHGVEKSWLRIWSGTESLTSHFCARSLIARLNCLSIDRC